MNGNNSRVVNNFAVAFMYSFKLHYYFKVSKSTEQQLNRSITANKATHVRYIRMKYLLEMIKLAIGELVMMGNYLFILNENLATRLIEVIVYMFVCLFGDLLIKIGNEFKEYICFTANQRIIY